MGLTHTQYSEKFCKQLALTEIGLELSKVKQGLADVKMEHFIKNMRRILPPDHYTESNLIFIASNVIELSDTVHDMKPWEEELGFDGKLFAFKAECRAHLRAELDAYCARLCDLIRDELRYILDPTDVLGEDYHSETFRVLKNRKPREFGEYRTQRLVLASWDQLETGDLY